ncbi:hypothetical protein ACJJTC_008000 [Scirpophaga incertulas]
MSMCSIVTLFIPSLRSLHYFYNFKMMINLRKCVINMPLLLRNLSTTMRVRSEELFVHRYSPDNNPNTPFEFTKHNKARIEALIQNYPDGAQRAALGPILDIVQRQIGWVPISAMHKVADILRIPRVRVYEWATFYTMIKRRSRGKYNVKVCVTTPCMIRGSDCILKAVEDVTCCSVGGLSPGRHVWRRHSAVSRGVCECTCFRCR